LCLFLTDYFTSAPGSFLFSLRNNDDLAPFKAPLRNENHGSAIVRNSRYGPSFGGGFDLYLANNAGSHTNSFTRFGHTYQAPPGYTYRQISTRSLLAGSEDFTPSEIETLYLNWNCAHTYIREQVGNLSEHARKNQYGHIIRSASWIYVVINL
jgi:hypothetical protein